MKIIINLVLLVFVFSSCQKAPTGPIYPWKPYSKQALEDAVSHQRPVLLDFYADWCPVCHELERTVFSRPEIKNKLSKVTALRVDATDQDDPKVQQLIQQYGIEGLPTVVFLNSHGHEINNLRVEGLVTAKEFAQELVALDLLK